jgi:hypothetical protein
LTLYGVRSAEVHAIGFSYDAVTFTAAWTFAAPLGADKWLIHLPDTLVDLSGSALDGEWTTGQVAAATGDGAAGGDLLFRVNTVPGDVNRSATTLGDDVVLVRNSQFKTIGAAGYSAFFDVNGSGTILGDDVVLTRNRQFSSLPVDEPSGPQAQMMSLSSPEVVAPLASAAPPSAVSGVVDADLLAAAAAATDPVRPRSRGVTAHLLTDGPQPPSVWVSMRPLGLRLPAKLRRG